MLESGEMSDIWLFSRCRCSKPVKLDKGEISDIEFHSRYTYCRLVAYSSPVKSLIFLLLAGKILKLSSPISA